MTTHLLSRTEIVSIINSKADFRKENPAEEWSFRDSYDETYFEEALPHFRMERDSQCGGYEDSLTIYFPQNKTALTFVPKNNYYLNHEDKVDDIFYRIVDMVLGEEYIRETSH